jgi:hypothetical protein
MSGSPCLAFASGGSTPEGQVSGMALIWQQGWVGKGLVAIPPTFLRIITPAQGAPGVQRCSTFGKAQVG